MSERAYAWWNALYAGLFFGFVFGLYMGWDMGWLPPSTGGDVAGIVAAMVASGTLFGLILGLFTRSPIVPGPEDIALLPGERLEYSGHANHFLNLEGRGGRLALTSTHLVFKPHAINIQSSELRIPRAEIAGVVARRTFGIVPNGLAVVLKSGNVEKFVVNGRDAWVARIAATSA